MITITSTQRKIKISTKKMTQDIKKILRHLGYQDYDVNILLTTNRTIRKYNKTYRHKDKATDILSFPFYPDLKPGQRIEATAPEESCLGDIIISLEYVRKDIKKLYVSFDDRTQRLLVHGICHLLGYDHETDEDYELMLAQENELLELIAPAR